MKRKELNRKKNNRIFQRGQRRHKINRVGKQPRGGRNLR